jgi:hypothetical protein
MDSVSESEIRRLVSQFQDETLAMDTIKVDTAQEAAAGEAPSDE